MAFMDTTRRQSIIESRAQITAWTDDYMAKLSSASQTGGALPEWKAPASVVAAYQRILDLLEEEEIGGNMFAGHPPESLAVMSAASVLYSIDAVLAATG